MVAAVVYNFKYALILGVCILLRVRVQVMGVFIHLRNATMVVGPKHIAV
jgi:hypothetical protein